MSLTPINLDLRVTIDPYVVLGVEEDASLAEIESAYWKHVLEYRRRETMHDELQKASAQKEFRKVQQSYVLLSDENLRIKYNQSVQDGRSPSNAYGESRRLDPELFDPSRKTKESSTESTRPVKTENETTEMPRHHGHGNYSPERPTPSSLKRDESTRPAEMEKETGRQHYKKYSPEPPPPFSLKRDGILESTRPAEMENETERQHYKKYSPERPPPSSLKRDGTLESIKPAEMGNETERQH